jgi:tRNA modification GTPase
MGGISVIRLSGADSPAILSKMAPFLPTPTESHRVYYGVLKSCVPKTLGEPVDEVMISFFQKGRSFTGENVFEISCHGSPQVSKRVIKELVFAGARIADRGEFTYRAFMNGRIDLVQAESVLSLIQSQSDVSTQQALRQLGGDLSRHLEDLEDNLIWCLAHLEAGIDFSAEGIEIVTNEELERRFSSSRELLERLLLSYNKGRLLKDGLKLVLAGEPNVGKSSLLNKLVEEDRAIVTEVAGTTRDTIEAAFFVDGVKVVVTDTAGLRDTEDRVEKMGIERSYKALNEADRIFFIYDLSQGMSERELKVIDNLDPAQLFIVGNMRDRALKNESSLIQELNDGLKTLKNFQKSQVLESFLETNVHFVSALNDNSAEVLKSALAKDLEIAGLEDRALISQARHFENLSRALECMNRASKVLSQNLSNEFLALDIKEALLFIQETLGKRFDDQVMDRVFKEFCIGK